jgi:hypothetical protein
MAALSSLAALRQYRQAHTTMVTVKDHVGGTITSTPAGIACGAACTVPFLEGMELKMTAKAEPGTQLARWTSGCSGRFESCTVVLRGAAKEFGALFEAGLWGEKYSNPHCSVTSHIYYPGEVLLNGWSSGRGDYQYRSTYLVGTEVKLTAVPRPGVRFNRWSGPCAAQGNPCTIQIQGSTRVNVSFDVNCLTISVSNSNTGSGTSGNPVGTCIGGVNPICNYVVPYGTPVSLWTIQLDGSTWVGWGGACAHRGLSRTCDIIMDGATWVSAKYRK